MDAFSLFEALCDVAGGGDPGDSLKRAAADAKAAAAAAEEAAEELEPS